MRIALWAIVFTCIWAMVWNAHSKQNQVTVKSVKKTAAIVQELTTEQLAMLDVGLSLDNLHRPMPKWKAARIMKHTKKQVQLASFISKIPAELPKSMRKKRA